MPHYFILNSNTISKSCLLPSLTSAAKGDHIYSSRVGIRKLFCESELENLFHVHGNALKVVKSKRNEDQIIGHLPDSLAEKSIMDKTIAATEGMWMKGGGIQIPCKYKLYGNDSYKDIAKNILEK